MPPSSAAFYAGCGRSPCCATRKPTGPSTTPPFSTNAWGRSRRATPSSSFPEGGSSENPFIGHVKTGVARMYFLARERGIDVPIIPVGINYEEGSIFRSSVLLLVAQPVDTSRASGPPRIGPDGRNPCADSRNRRGAQRSCLPGRDLPGPGTHHPPGESLLRVGAGTPLGGTIQKTGRVQAPRHRSSPMLPRGDEAAPQACRPLSQAVAHCRHAHRGNPRNTRDLDPGRHGITDCIHRVGLQLDPLPPRPDGSSSAGGSRGWTSPR